MPLSTNWFKTGDNHISEKDGSNALPNDGSQSAPYQTIEGQIVAGNNIIRSGVYAPAAGGTLDVGGKNLIGDSENVFIYNIAGDLNEITTSGGDCILDTLQIFNVNLIFQALTSNQAQIKNCFIENTNTLKVEGSSTIRHEKNIFKDIVNFYFESNGETIINHFTNSNFINCNISGVGPGVDRDNAVHLNNYFQNCAFTSVNSIDQTITFQNCVFDATSTFEGTLFKDIFLSTSDPNKSPQTEVLESTSSANINKGTFNLSYGTSNVVQFVNCYWIDKANPTPVFNDEAGGDYSLSLSPNQSVLFNAGNIVGARPLALTLNANSQPFNTGAGNGSSLVNLTNNAGKFELTTPGEGTATSAILNSANITGNQVIKLPQRILLTDAIRFFGNLLPQNALSGTGEVVDRLNYNAGVNDEVRYTIRLRYWDDDETPGNEVKPAGGGWYEIEHGNIFGIEIDGTGKGNGNVDVDIPNLTPIFADKFQVEFVLRDNGN